MSRFAALLIVLLVGACSIADAARCMKGLSANPDQTCTEKEEK
jgi:hypothetical protein